MKPHVALLALVVLFVPVVAADDPVAPAVSHVKEKAADAQQDPRGFAEGHAGRKAIENETLWTKDYVCARLDDVDEEAGTDVGSAACPRDPDVAAGAEEQVEAKAEPLEAEVEELATDAVGAAEQLVDDVLRDPPDAVAAIVRFLDAILSAIVGAVTGILLALDEVLAELGLGLRDVGIALRVAGQGVLMAGAAVADAAQGLADGTAGAVESVTKAVSDAVEDVSSWVQSIFDGQRHEAKAPDLEPPAVPSDPLAPVDDLLGSLPVPVEAS